MCSLRYIPNLNNWLNSGESKIILIPARSLLVDELSIALLLAGVLVLQLNNMMR